MIWIFFYAFSLVILSFPVFCSEVDLWQCGEIRPLSRGLLDQGNCKDNPTNDKMPERIRMLEKALNEGKPPLEAALSMNLNDTNQTSARRDCTDVASEGFNQSGVYDVTIDGRVVAVYCDLENEGGGWLVFQRRIQATNFVSNGWGAYEKGFGNSEGGFWLGLENLHKITSSASYKLRVSLVDWESSTAYASYSSFSIGNSSTNYTLSVTGYNGTAGDSLKHHNNQPFRVSPKVETCASVRCGGWWENSCCSCNTTSCSYSNLNGKYVSVGRNASQAVIWTSWKQISYSMNQTEMKVRRN